MAHPQVHRPEPVQLDALPVSSAQASGDVELGPRIVTLYRLRLPRVARERHIRSQTDDLSAVFSMRRCAAVLIPKR